MTRVPLQVGLFVPFAPDWLSSAVILLGLVIVVGHVYAGIFRALDLPSAGVLGYFTNATSALFLGVAFASLIGLVPWYLAGNWVLVGLLGFLGQWVQGVSSIRFLQKVRAVVLEGHLPGSGLVEKIKFRLLVYLVVLLIAWAVVYAFVFTTALESIGYALVLFWTLFVFATSLLGLLWKVTDAYGSMPTALLVGVVLMVAGASIQNLTFLGDLGVVVIGKVGYTGGYLAGYAIWIRRELE